MTAFRCMAVIVVAVLGGLRAEDAAPAATPAATYSRGVNIAGAEFGKGIGVVHKDYTFNNEATYKYFSEKGFDCFRVPIKWERIQPKLNAAFEKEYLGGLKKNVEWAKKFGGKVLIDVHNYGRYPVEAGDKRKGMIIDVPDEEGGEAGVKTADFCDLWKRLSDEFKDETAIFGYGLMNEPHDMKTADWKAISNAAVKAIRDNGDKHLILVAGLHWSGAGGWPSHNGPDSWVKDPLDNFMYEAHCYFDSDNSGSYKQSYEEELKKNPRLEDAGPKRLADFTGWCQKNKVRGFLGEFGVPRSDPRWHDVVLEKFMTAMDEAGMGGTYWAAGTYWGEGYSLSVQPKKGETEDRPQMAVLLKHLSKK